MKKLFDDVSYQCSKEVTQSYSTSFSLATKLLDVSIRQDIYNVYGFVCFTDEIVDSFHDYHKEEIFNRFEADLEHALEHKISLNPILNSFQNTFHQYNIDRKLIDAFMRSMRWDLHKSTYLTEEDYKAYIYGSADVVGLMCIPPEGEPSTKYFREMSDLNKSLNLDYLSMGMSSDYLEAAKNNATHLRIGSNIFGSRI